MKAIAVTGANGFVGKNLVADLNLNDDYKVLPITKATPLQERDQYLKQADFIVHLAGVNRTEDDTEYTQGNVYLLQELLGVIQENPKHPTILLSSSIHAANDTPYGRSKLEAEEVLEKFAEDNENEILIYRFPNLFGKWCNPDYNSVVATFCYHISRNAEVSVHDSNVQLTLNYIDDVVAEIERAIKGNPTLLDNKPTVPNVLRITVGNLVKKIKAFKQSRENLTVPHLADPLEKALYSTYLSYLPEDDFSYMLPMHTDDRGSFTEFIKTVDHGQVSINVSKPGVTKGNHWHHTKVEKFLVVSGKGVIRFRNIRSNEIIEYFVTGTQLEVVDVPVGYTHNIENLGDSDLITVMWANEPFNPANPDTYALEV
ncbi:NAD-dependent epimerase/dehydratase family protein [Staphylococcus debuckii]|uniref:polysaccharide biosynthesis C-terminal domain-containing protein n=1 Tax=Staphylococcus debuckii TaxID=2044912 RepID=UPI000F431079|nr:NAD-dependent epimerase/dehydratase family protein [Staphylococcus debuckii]AYU55004.1 SDR family oxidoreductase [Staphylococcus debuckii]